uniref:Uncharacterized protein n=1 Tax=Aegilops tauschii subsp. strangulata TaxID=200361 RepID=A0A452Z980_AEGTS
ELGPVHGVACQRRAAAEPEAAASALRYPHVLVAYGSDPWRFWSVRARHVRARACIHARFGGGRGIQLDRFGLNE